MMKVVFLDKDGTLINDVPYNVDPDLIILQERAVKGLQKLQGAGYKFIVVSNQSGVARGYFKEQALVNVREKLAQLLAANQIALEGFYYCPHHPEGKNKAYAVACQCRKPMPGLLLRAAQEHQIDMQSSWMIGDILNDVEAGNRAGCRTILIDNGGETEWIKDSPLREPEATFYNIDEAADYILQHTAVLAPFREDLAGQ